MKNANQPAFPCNIIDGEMQQDSSGQITGFKKIKSTGLTKREYFIGIAMRELIGESQYINKVRYTKVAERAIALADEVLKQIGE